MKTNPSFRIFKLYTFVPLGIAIAAAIVPRPVSAGTVNTLLITENSPTSLSVTYNGSQLTATSVGPEQWQVVFPFSFHSIFTKQWIEPENSSLVNRVSFPMFIFNTLTIFSDVTPIGPPSSRIPDDTAVQIGTDNNGVPVIATFDDDAGGTEVPDTGSTFALLLLSLIGLLGATQLRSARSA
jgi:hypothetical protein